jgi:hypothetical protein
MDAHLISLWTPKEKIESHASTKIDCSKQHLRRIPIYDIISIRPFKNKGSGKKGCFAPETHTDVGERPFHEEATILFDGLNLL